MGAAASAAPALPEQKASSSRWNSLRAIFALRDSGLGEVAWKIGMALISFSDANGVCTVSCQRLAEAARTSRSGVYLGLAKLQAAGPIQVDVQRRAYAGAPAPNRYVLTLRPDIAVPAPVESQVEPARSSEVRLAIPAKSAASPDRASYARSSVQLNLFAALAAMDDVQPHTTSSPEPTTSSASTDPRPAEARIADPEKISKKNTHIRARERRVPRVSPNQLRLPIEELLPSEGEVLHAQEQLGPDVQRVLGVFKAHASEPRVLTQEDFDRRFRAYVLAVGKPLAKSAPEPRSYPRSAVPAPEPPVDCPPGTPEESKFFYSAKWDTEENRRIFLNHPNHHLACPGPKCDCHEIKARTLAKQRKVA